MLLILKKYAGVAVLLLFFQEAFSQSFTEAASVSGINHFGYQTGMIGGGVAIFDFNNDSLQDIYLTGGSNRDLLYKNLGNGQFQEVGTTAGLWGTLNFNTMGVVTGDIDNDGDRDIFVTTAGRPGYANPDDILPNLLFRNNGNGTFTDISASSGITDTGCSMSAAFTDYDKDGDVDIHLVNDFGEWVRPDALFRNNYPLDSFTGIGASVHADVGIYGMGIAIGDYDEDGDLDYYITNIGRNVLLNNHNGIFTDMTDSAGVANIHSDTLLATSWGTAFLDFDNNTYLDLFVANGWIPAADFIATAEKDANQLYLNNTDGTFTDIAVAAGLNDSSASRGFAFGDFDNDGDLDLFVTVIDHDPSSSKKSLLFRNNNSNGNHWIEIKLEGTVTNRDGYGSLVRVVAGGRSFIREIDGGSSHASQNSSIAHFGLGSYTTVDSIIVKWLNGFEQVITNVNADQYIEILENPAGTVFTNLQIALCQGDSVFAGGNYQTASGIYVDTLTAVSGLDSIVTSTINVFPVQTTLTSATICSGDSIYAGGNYQTVSGFYYDTMTAASGCDSIIETDLFVALNYFSSMQISLCNGDSTLINGKYQSASGVYYDTLTSSDGCDSIMEFDLTILYDSVRHVRDTINYGDSLFAGGSFQSVAGSYVDTFISREGCDSIVVTELEVRLATAVAVLDDDIGLMVFPNPAKEMLTITYDLPEKSQVSWKIFNFLGEEIESHSKNLQQPGKHFIQFHLSLLYSGIYFLQFTKDRQMKVLRFSKLD